MKQELRELRDANDGLKEQLVQYVSPPPATPADSADASSSTGRGEPWMEHLQSSNLSEVAKRALTQRLASLCDTEIRLDELQAITNML